MRKSRLKGFTKGKGSSKKFIPTSTRRKSALSKSDIKRETRHEDSIPFGAISQFAQDKAQNKIVDVGNKVNNPLFGEAVKEVGKEKGKSALNFLATATKDSIKKTRENQKEKQKKQKEIQADQERIQQINQDVIDDILDNRSTTNEQKFRFLQRYAVENNSSLTDSQRNFINNSLMKLEAEQNTPTTFAGVKTGSSSSSSSKKDKTTTQEIPKIKLLSGRMETPTEFEQKLNLAKSMNPNIIPTISNQSTTTTTTTTTPNNISDNLNAEIGAVVG